MKINKVFLVLAFSIFSLNCFAQIQSVKNVVQSFLDTVKSNAYMSPNLNWDSISNSLLNDTKEIDSTAHLAPHFNKVLRALKDGHSRLYPKSALNSQQDEKSMLEIFATMTDKEAGLPPKRFIHKMINNKYAYINIPSVMLENRAYVDTIGKQLLELDKHNPKGWIIDVTENDGGNAFTMNWHFPTLIDSEQTYSTVDNNGKVSKNDKILDLKNTSEEEKRAADLFKLNPDSVPYVKLKNTKVPIIILTSKITGSAGEFVTVHFKGQKNVLVVGQVTAGATSSNHPFEITNEYLVNLTTEVIKDRTGKIYKIGEGITPDVQFDINLNKVAQKDKLSHKEELNLIIGLKDLYIDNAIKALENWKKYKK